MKPQRFAAAINCIDGRAQVPATNWLRVHCNVDYVDLITEPGAVKCLSQKSSDVIAGIETKLRLALAAHAPSAIAVVGHHDCLANPVSKEEQQMQIIQAVDAVDSWSIGVRIVGLYVNEWHSVDLVFDTQERR